MLQRENGVSFVERIANLLERTEYRRAETWEEREPLYRLRHEAYAREGYIQSNSRGLFHDEEDEVDNAWLFGVFIDGDLAASLRLHIASKPEEFLPIASRFPEAIEPRLRAGEVVIDTTRLSSRLEYSRAYPCLPYLMMRCTFVAADHFGADWMVAATRAEYEGAYRRMWGAKRVAGPLPYPPLAKPHVMMAYDYAASREEARRRYPFLESTEAERLALFGRSSSGACDLYAALTAARRSRTGMQQEMACVA